MSAPVELLGVVIQLPNEKPRLEALRAQSGLDEIAKGLQAVPSQERHFQFGGRHRISRTEEGTAYSLFYPKARGDGEPF
jgi:hypothetical protein